MPWVGTWAIAVQPSERTFKQQTLRQIVHTSIGGGSARIRLSNVHGTGPLTVTSANLARPARGSAVAPATVRPLTFLGAASVTIPAGDAVVSDEVTFPVPADGDVAVSLYVPGETGPSTGHGAGTQHNYVAAGDQSAAATLSGARATTSYSFLSGLDVRNPGATGAVVTFGASITDGVGSAVSANRRWPNLLADRLRAAGHTVGVLNTGISGNQLTADRFGDRAGRRLQRDVLDQPGARRVILSDVAINDLGNSGTPSATLITEFEQLVSRARAAGLTVICSTLTPFRGAGYWTEAAEQGRAAFNTFIRSPGTGCDAVLDLADATADPADPDRYARAYDSGDHLHPSNAGMQAIANAVDLTWLTP
ncbi:GDSL-type esterase/lipase family protein [Actinoplanes sp. NPDC051861]|uniref:GDSL-type esterase/lipase family protein n=1 Tax=Actinoplanes sp. NPDC051861 TaxID=3155170 RepID=UPI003424A818